MREELRFNEDDRIAVIAPHPDDECLGVSAALLRVPEQVDIFVISDGSHGNPECSIEDEAHIRKEQFEAEMKIVKPHAWHWLGVEDTKIARNAGVTDTIDFMPYTKIFLPWDESLHPDHRATAEMCFQSISKQKAQADFFMYEINAPFHKPTHYIDITDLEEQKRNLVRCHEDQNIQENITLPLNAFRASQMINHPDCHYAECFLKVDPYEKAYSKDLLFKLYTFRENYELYEKLEEKGVVIKCVMPSDITPVYDFIKENFARAWADEALPALINGGCYVAVQNGRLLAFGCAEATGKNFAGPCGTVEDAPCFGLYPAIMQRVLRHMKEQGYRYAIGGMVRPDVKKLLALMVDYVEIEGSRDSYANLLSRRPR